MGRPKGSSNKSRKKVEAKVEVVRKDVMKPQPVHLGEKPKPEGGMAHAVDKKADQWGGKLPPLPRSALNRSKEQMRSGMALING